MTAGATKKYAPALTDNTELLVEKRWGLPEDIGMPASTMARGDIPYASGQVIYVDGGFTMNRLKGVQSHPVCGIRCPWLIQLFKRNLHSVEIH